MRFFRIKNYEKYQGQAGANQKPWIKLHKKIQNDWAYGQLHDSHKAAFIHLLLNADSVGNQFPYDARSLRLQLSLSSPVKIEVFERLGFIEEIVPDLSLRVDKDKIKIRVDKDKIKEKPGVCVKTLKSNFEEDWAEYPKKKGANKIKSFDCYKRTVGIEKRAEFNSKTQDYIDSFDDGDLEYCKNADTWFRNWEGIEVSKDEKLKELSWAEKYEAKQKLEEQNAN